VVDGAVAAGAPLVAGGGVALCVVAVADAAAAGAFADLASAEALAEPGRATDPPAVAEAAAAGVFAGAPLVVVPCADATDIHKSDASSARAAFRTLITEPSRQ
jgi:hypothetical protein